jgi:hypothetical protein
MSSGFHKMWSDLCQDRLFITLIGMLLFVRTIYLASYPFFIEGDGYTYYELINDFHSHLNHATGYVFFSAFTKPLSQLLLTEPAYLLRYSQQAHSMLTVALLYVAMKRVLSTWLSFLACLLLGIDTQVIVAAGTTRPEFFQANILMAVLAFSLFGLTSDKETRKDFFYTGIGVLLMAGYLSKYNFLPCFVFCAVSLFDWKMSWRLRFRIFGHSVLGSCVLLAIFLLAFHYPTTRTFHLNLEHGWIYILKLKEANIPLSPSNGIATEKYLILADSLPPVGAGPFAWRRLDQIPEGVRSPFRQAWSPILRSTDRHQIRTLFAKLRTSKGERKNYYDPNVFCSLYYYLGLQETEDLLSQVFREGLRAHPEKYIVNVWQVFLESASFHSSYVPYVPVPGVYEPPFFFDFSQRRFLAPRARIFKAVDWSVMRPEDLAAQIWSPGARLFSLFAVLNYISLPLLWVTILAGFIPVGVSLWRRQRLDPTELLFVISFMGLVGIMQISAVVFVFRMKELILCQPLIYIVFALAVSLWIGQLYRYLGWARGNK